jgi:hypothetical protein
MLADREWKTPHPRPGGRSVAEWVESVRRLERDGWLKDPADVPLGRPRTRAEDVSMEVCLHLCWRGACIRAGRCRHLIPLAVREWMPEIAIRLSELWGIPVDAPHHHDREKLELLREVLG